MPTPPELPPLRVERAGPDVQQVIPLDGISDLPPGQPSRPPAYELRRKARLEGTETGSAQHADPFERIYGLGTLQALEPPLDFDRLNEVPSETNILGPCIQAYVDNIAGHGWRLVSRLKPDDPRAQKFEAEIQAEAARLSKLLAHVNPRATLPTIRGAVRRDREALGNGFLEVIRSRRGEVIGLQHVPGVLVRLCPTDPSVVMVEQPIFDTESLTWERRGFPMTFRRFVHFPMGNQADLLYFKEYGDPREMHRRSGAFVALGTLKPEEQATEIIHLTINPYQSAYGEPRWIGAILEALGVRRAAEVNYDLFENKGVPPLVVLVSGGHLDENSTKAIQKHFKSIQGQKRFWSPLVLQAEPASMGNVEAAMAGISGSSTVRIEIIPLQQFMQDDSLYKGYVADNRKYVRATFNLSPMATGESDDFSRAAANAGLLHDEAHAYAPRRRSEDEELFDLRLLPEWGIRFHRVESLRPSALQDEDLADLLTIGHEAAALRPNEVRSALAGRLNIDLPPIPQEYAQDVPSRLVTEAGARSWRELEPGAKPPGAPAPGIEPPAKGGNEPSPANTPEGTDTGEDADGQDVDPARGTQSRKAAVPRIALDLEALVALKQRLDEIGRGAA